MHRSNIVPVLCCMTLVGAGWISGDRAQAETIKSDRLVTAQSNAIQPDGVKLSTPNVLARLDVKATSAIEPQAKVSMPLSKQQRLIDDIKDSPLSSSRLLPDVGAFR